MRIKYVKLGLIAPFLILFGVAPVLGQVVEDDYESPYRKYYTTEKDTAQQPLVRYEGALIRSFAFTAIPATAGALLASLTEGAGDIAGASLIIYGIVWGPSKGHLYAENERRARIGTGIRGLGIGTIFIASTIVAVKGIDDLTTLDDGEFNDYTDAKILIASGYLIIGAGVAYSFISLKRSVNDHNERIRKGVLVQLAPSYDFKSGTPLVSTRISF